MIRALILVLAATAALAADAPARHVVVLTDGTTWEVAGPVERRDGAVVFRDRTGLLVSLRDEEVAEIRVGPRPEPDGARPAPSAESPAPAPPAAGTATAERGGALLYTTDDLPPLPATPPSAPAGETDGDGEADAAAPAPEVPGTDLARVAAPSEVDGRPESWWRDEIARLRAEVVELRRQEDVTHRLLVCALDGLSLEDGECRPRVNRQPPVNVQPSTRTQRHLAEKLAETRSALERSRAALAEFIADAAAAGVPTAWLLEPADEPPPTE